MKNGLNIEGLNPAPGLTGASSDGVLECQNKVSKRHYLLGWWDLDIRDELKDSRDGG